MSEQDVIKQHYISQCILKHFSNSKGQVYETLVGTQKLYQTNYRNSMVEKFTYEHPEIEKNNIEKYFSKIESYFCPAIEDIILTINKYECGESDLYDIKKMIIQYMNEFIIFYYRSGALLTEFEFERNIKEDRIFLMLQKVLNSSYIESLSNTIINYYDFAILKSENKEFLLSDQYLSTVALAIKNRFLNMSNRHIGMKDMMILIPLSCNYYAAFFSGQIPSYIKKNKINILNQGDIDEINMVIINNSYVKCVGNNRFALERVIDRFIYKSPSAVYAGGNGIHAGATLKKEVFLYERDNKAWELFTGLDFVNFRDLKRNDKCACGSGKKFKKCCIDYVNICKRMYDDILYNSQDYKVNDNAIGEKSIAEFYSKD